MARLAVSIQAGAVLVSPGGSAAFTVEVRNVGTVVDRYRCGILGLDPTWTTVSPPVLELFPYRDGGDPRHGSDEPPSTGHFTVTVHPPRDPVAVAGPWPIGAMVTSEHDQSNRVVEETTITVLPFGALEAALHPRVLSGRLGASTNIELVNQGNRPEEITIVASDPSARIDFQVDRSTVSIGPGERATIRIRLSAGAPEIIGGRDTRPFSVELRAQSRDIPPPSLNGSFEKRALLSTGVPVAIATLVALAMGGAALVTVMGLVGQSSKVPTSDAPSLVIPTPTAVPPTQVVPSPTEQPTISPTPVVTPGEITPAPVSDHLAVGGELLQNDFLESPNGLYRLTLQGDGNLVLTRTDVTGPDSVLWAPIKFLDEPAYVGVVQGDGNFVLYRKKPISGPAIWATNTVDTAAEHSATLTVQDDGNLVVYWEGGVAKWASRNDLGCQQACEYVVRPGDTLTAIAKRYGLSPSQLVDANPGIDPGDLKPGEILKIPSR